MNTGEGLVWVAVIVIFSLGVYQVTKRKKWKSIGKVLGLLLMLSAIVSVGIYGYIWYTQLPFEATQLGKISLGMSPVEVTLELGEPSSELMNDKNQKRFTYKDYYKTIDYHILFGDSDSGSLEVVLVCSEDYDKEVFGLGVYDNEERVIKKLGEPTITSIREDGLMKTISYENWKVSFGIQKGEVTLTCVTQSGKTTFSEEYKQ